MRAFAEWGQLTPETRVLDVGGSPAIWDLIRDCPNVTLLNLKASDGAFPQVVADATRLPFADNSFDIVFSNSVIEHVNGHAAFADEVRRVGRSYFIQTPNRSFPLEPHVMTPLVNYLPKRWQRRMYRNFTVWGLLMRPDQAYVDSFVDETNLLSRRDLIRLFPGATISGMRSLVASS
jgi:hypothetical protein